MDAAEVERIVVAFTAATNRHDVEEMLALVSEDVVFEGTTPPDGVRIVGDKASLRALWEGIFRASPSAIVETEELIACGDRCTALLRYVSMRSAQITGMCVLSMSFESPMARSRRSSRT